MVFALMVNGLVLWISYRSFLYSELSTPLIKNPFSDLESFAKSDYMWVFCTFRIDSTPYYTQIYVEIMKNLEKTVAMITNNYLG